MARSPWQRILAWVVLWRRFHLLRRRPRRGPGWVSKRLGTLVGPAFEPHVREGFGDPVLPGGGQVVGGAGKRLRGPEQPSKRIGKDLDVHAVAFVFPGVIRGVGGDAVDRQQGAVEDDERLRPDRPHCLG